MRYVVVIFFATLVSTASFADLVPTLCEKGLNNAVNIYNESLKPIKKEFLDKGFSEKQFNEQITHYVLHHTFLPQLKSLSLKRRDRLEFIIAQGRANANMCRETMIKDHQSKNPSDSRKTIEVKREIRIVYSDVVDAFYSRVGIIFPNEDSSLQKSSAPSTR